MAIELQQKKFFLKWAMHHLLFPQREIYWILNYLVNHPLILREMHLVEHAEKTPRGMKIIIDHNLSLEEPTLQLFLNGHCFTSTDQIFHEIRLNKKKTLYFELVFQNAWQTPEYLEVLEDNPYYRWNDQVSDETRHQIDQYFEKIFAKQRLDELQNEINEALEAEDWDRLNQLSAELKKYRAAKGCQYE